MGSWLRNLWDPGYEAGQLFDGERAQRLRAHVAERPRAEQKGHGRRLVGEVECGDEVVLALGIVEADHLAAEPLSGLLRMPGALRHLLHVADALLGKSPQNDVGWHRLASPRACRCRTTGTAAAPCTHSCAARAGSQSRLGAGLD